MNNFGISGFSLAGWALALVLGAYLVLSQGPHDAEHAVATQSNTTGPASLSLEAFPDTHSGYNLWLKTENFRFAPRNAGAAESAGEGHAHLYVNGKKSRVYGNWVHLNDAALRLGKNKIHVTLNENSHAEVTVDGKIVEAMLTLDGPDPIAVRGAWVRSTVPMRPAAMYMRLGNNTGRDIALIGASAPDFNRVEIHESLEKDGVMSMAPVDSIPVKTGGMAKLKQGGLHVMLMQPNRELAEGDEVKATLEFSDGTLVDVVAPVSKMPPHGPGHDHSAHDHSAMDNSAMDHGDMHESDNQ